MSKGFSSKFMIIIAISLVLTLCLPAFAASQNIDLDYNSSEDMYYANEHISGSIDSDFEVYFQNTDLAPGDKMENYIRFDNTSSSDWYYGYWISIPKDMMFSGYYTEPSWSDAEMILNESKDGDEIDCQITWGDPLDLVESGETAAGYIDWEWQGTSDEYWWRLWDQDGTDDQLFCAGYTTSGACPVDPAVMCDNHIGINVSRQESLETDNNEVDIPTKNELLEQGKLVKDNIPIYICDKEGNVIHKTNSEEYIDNQVQIWSDLKKQGKIKHDPYDN